MILAFNHIYKYICQNDNEGKMLNKTVLLLHETIRLIKFTTESAIPNRLCYLEINNLCFQLSVSNLLVTDTAYNDLSSASEATALYGTLQMYY